MNCGNIITLILRQAQDSVVNQNSTMSTQVCTTFARISKAETHKVE